MARVANGRGGHLDSVPADEEVPCSDAQNDAEDEVQVEGHGDQHQGVAEQQVHRVHGRLHHVGQVQHLPPARQR